MNIQIYDLALDRVDELHNILNRQDGSMSELLNHKIDHFFQSRIIYYCPSCKFLYISLFIKAKLSYFF